MSCMNVLRQVTNTQSDEALLENAKKSIDVSDYNTALDSFSKMSAAFTARADVIENWASAYAGKCGLKFSTLFTAIGAADFSTDTLFKYLMSSFQGIAVDPASCVLAEAKIKQLGATATLRNTNQNIFMLILSMAKIGAYMRAEGDRDGTSNLGDGSTDAGFSACTVSATNLPGNGTYSDNDVKEIVTGFGNLIDSYSVVGSVLSGASSTISSITTSCAALSPNPCTITEAASVTAGSIAAMRDLIATNKANTTIGLGIGSCSNVLVVPCCP
jgi:hypothetical protein